MSAAPHGIRPHLARRGGSLPALAVLLFVALAASACGASRKGASVPVAANASRVDVYIRPVGPQPFAITMDLAAVRLRDVDGQEVELELQLESVRSSGGGRRVALAGSTVPPSAYVALVLEVRSATLSIDGQTAALDLLPPLGGPEGLELAPAVGAAEGAVAYAFPIGLEVGPRRALSLFLDWRVESSVVDGTAFLPDLLPAQEAPQAVLGRLYVSDSASNTVLAVDRRTGEVLATGKVGDEPLALAVSNDLRRVFVANARDGSLSLVDLNQNLATSTIPVRLRAGTCDVVLAEPRLAVTTNRSLDTVSFFDTLQAVRLEDVRVGREPIRLAAAPFLRRLFVVNARADSLSVINVTSRTVLGTVATESEPTDVSVGRRQAEVFVCHRTSPNLLVIDAASLAPVDSIFVGVDATAVLADQNRDRVYVARANPPELAIVDRRLQAVVRRVPIRGPVTSLAQPITGSRVYGASPGAGGLVVVDVVRAVEEPFLPCGQSPTDVVVVD